MILFLTLRSLRLLRVAALFSVVVPTAVLAQEPTALAYLNGSIPNTSSTLLDLSADGRFALIATGAVLIPTGAYTSGGNTLYNGGLNLFVRDSKSGTYRYANVIEPQYPGGSDRLVSSLSASISGDGHVVAFVQGNASAQNNHAYARDLINRHTVLLSPATDGQVPNGKATNPVISQDGRFVAYTSTSTNLYATGPLAPLTAGEANLFVYDLTAGELKVAAVTPSGEALAAGVNSTVGGIDISPDGQWVVYSTLASNAHPDTPGSPLSLCYARNHLTGEVRLLSRNSNGGVLSRWSSDFTRAWGLGVSAFDGLADRPGMCRLEIH